VCRLPDIVKIRDMAVAAQSYARAAKLSGESLAQAAEIKLLAEQKAGRVLAKLEKSKGGGYNQHRRKDLSQAKDESSPYRKTLCENKINHNQAMRWQQLAKLDDKQMKATIQATKQRVIGASEKLGKKAKMAKTASSGQNKRSRIAPVAPKQGAPVSQHPLQRRLSNDDQHKQFSKRWHKALRERELRRIYALLWNGSEKINSSASSR
jgi:hypothetical protein